MTQYPMTRSLDAKMLYLGEVLAKYFDIGKYEPAENSELMNSDKMVNWRQLYQYFAYT